MNCLVTGGAGFIGSHLVERLVHAGHHVRVLDDFSSGKTKNLEAVEKRIDVVHGSITDPGIVQRATAGCEVVYHLAALPSVVKSVEDPLRSHEICATGTVQVLDAARRQGVRRVVYAGSSSAYGDLPGEIRREDDALCPLSPYAAAKLAGEHYCACFSAVYNLETVRLRFFNVFGPRQDASSPYSGVIALFIAALKQGRQPTIFGDGLQSRDFVYVDNVVDALTSAAQAPGAVGNVYNIGTGDRITILDLVSALNRVLGTTVQPLMAPPRAGDVRYSQADISKARRDLAYEPRVALLDGLRRMI